MSVTVKGLVRDSVVFTLASGVQKSVQLLFIPVITAHLGKEALKVYDVTLTYALLFSWLGVLGQDVAASVHFFDGDKSAAARTQVIPTGLLIQVVATALLMLGLLGAFYPMSQTFFGSDVAVRAGWQVALWTIPGTVAVNYVLNILRWKGRSRAYLLLCCFQTVCTLAPCLYLILAMDGGIETVLWSHVAAISVSGGLGVWLVRDDLTWRGAFQHSNKVVIKPMLLYGILFGSAAFFFGLLPAIDRSFLLRFGLQDALPEYALAAKIGAMIGLMTTSVGLAASTHAFRTWHLPASGAAMGRLFELIALAFCLLVPLTLLGRNMLVDVFADSGDYPNTAKLLPYFLYGWIADGLLYFAMLGLYKSKRAGPPLIVLAGSAGLAALLNAVLIPRLGAPGAALSFMLAKSAQVVASWWWSQRYFRMQVHAWLVGIAVLISFVLSWLAYWIPPTLFAILLLAFAAASWWAARIAGLLPFTSREHGILDTSAFAESSREG